MSPAAMSANAEPGATPHEVSLPVRIDHPGFATSLGASLSVLARDGISHARLHLNPAEMGPVTVQIQVQGQTAQVQLVAEQATTRQALEQAMPNLATALRDTGLTLTGGGVFDRQANPEGQQGHQGQHQAGRPSAALLVEPTTLAPEPALRAAHGSRAGLLDMYA